MFFADLTHRSFLCDWLRPDAGFQWEDEARPLRELLGGASPLHGGPPEDEGPWLVPHHSAQKPFARRYGPLGQADLHRQFARLTTPETILRFANTFGMLTPGELVVRAGDEDGTVGESFQLWREQIERMRRLLALWDGVRTGQRHRLEPYVWWERNPDRVYRGFTVVDGTLDERASLRQRYAVRGGVSFTVVDGQRVPAPAVIMRGGKPVVDPAVAGKRVAWLNDPPITDPSIPEDWRFGDVIKPMRDYVFQEVNRQVDGHISSVVLPLRPGALYSRVDWLLTALYVRFQLELAGAAETPRLAGKPCEMPGCTAMIPKRAHYCDDCREEARKATKRRSWHKRDARATPATTPVSTPVPADAGGR